MSTLVEELEQAAKEARAMARSSVAMGLVDQVTVYQAQYERLRARAEHVRRMLECYEEMASKSVLTTEGYSARALLMKLAGPLSAPGEGQP